MGTNLRDYMNDDTEFLLTQAEKLNDVYWLESNEGDYV